MPAGDLPRPRKWTRRVGRAFLLAAAVLLLVFFAALACLQRFGLPSFLEERLTAQLAQRGWTVSWSELRLVGLRSLRARDVRVEDARSREGPSLYLQKADVRFGFGLLGSFGLDLKSAQVAGGRIDFPLSSSDGGPRKVSIDHLDGDLSIQPDDRWQLHHLRGETLGIHWQISGALTNVSYWKRAIRLSKKRPQKNWQPHLDRLVTQFQRLRFPAPPHLKLTAFGDMKKSEAISAAVEFNAPEIISPWAAAHEFSLRARTAPGGAAERSQGQLEWELSFSRLEFGRGGAGRVSGHGTLAPLFTDGQEGLARIELEIENLATLDGSARRVECRLEGKSLDWREPRWPGLLHARLEQVETRWARAGEVETDFRFFQPLSGFQTDPALGFWNKLWPYPLEWEAKASRLSATNAQVDSVSCSGRWQAPELALNQIHGQLYGRTFDATGRLDVVTRVASAAGAFDFDLKKLAEFFVPDFQTWLEQFEWKRAPAVEAEARVQFDEWTHQPQDWKGVVAPTLGVAGRFRSDGGEFRTIPVSAARSHFYFTNLTWSLPDLEVTRPEGVVMLDYKLNPRLKQFYWGIRGRADPLALKPLFDEKEFAPVEEFTFTGPAEATGQIWGAWRPFRLAMRGEVAATNFTYRGERCSSLEAHLDLTNKFFIFTNVMVRRDAEFIHAPGMGIDVTNQVLYFTNVLTQMDPDLVARTIGPKVAANLEPYRFDEPPTVIVNGALHLARHPEADLSFEVDGGAFHYWKFNLDSIRADLRWFGDSLSISNLEGQFYDGWLIGDADFDFAPTNRTDFHFDSVVEQADLHLLMSDINSSSNKLEGLLSGQLLVTSANSKDWKSWQGGGHVELREGLIWEIPLFGIFTPVLEKISPGLATATEGTATFGMTNSIISTGDMKIFSPALRLEYKGTVDFDRRVDGKMEALILRDVSFIGPLVRFALTPLTKLFEYKVTGELSHPRAEPLYIPKFLQIPMHPFHTLHRLFAKPEARDPLGRPSTLQISPPGITDY